MANKRLSPSELTPEMQSFPRIMLFEFIDNSTDTSRPVATLLLIDAWPNAFPDGPIPLNTGTYQGYAINSRLGDDLTNNSTQEDGYRFHDAFHIGSMAALGWSPVMRSLLGIKRRGSETADDVEDGGRAIVFEEYLFDFLGMAEIRDGTSIEEDIDLLFASLSVQKFLRSRTTLTPKQTEIYHALLAGAKLFQKVKTHLGGYVLANLDNRSAIFISKETDDENRQQQTKIS